MVVHLSNLYLTEYGSETSLPEDEASFSVLIEKADSTKNDLARFSTLWEDN